MRSPARILLTVALCSAAALAPAAGTDEQYLGQCKRQLSQRYGEAADIKLVSMRRAGNGVNLKVAVRLPSATAGEEKVEFTSCRIAREQLPGTMQGVTMENHPAGADSVGDPGE